MRWPVYILFAYLVVGIQLGFGQMLSYAGATPNVVLIAAVFVAACASRSAAVWGAFLLGLLQDWVSTTPMGLFALSYGLTGLAIARARLVATPDHPLGNFLFTLVGGVVTALIVWLQSKFIGTPAKPDTLPPVGISLWPLLLSGFYSALLALPLLWLMGKAKPLLGFRIHRPRW